MNLRVIQVVIECFERSTVERIGENSNDVSRCLFIRLVYLNGNNAAEGENNIKYANSYPVN